MSHFVVKLFYFIKHIADVVVLYKLLTPAVEDHIVLLFVQVTRNLIICGYHFHLVSLQSFMHSTNLLQK